MTPKQLLLWQQKVMICSSKKSGVIFFLFSTQIVFYLLHAWTIIIKYWPVKLMTT